MLRPIKSKEFIGDVAKELNEPEGLVESVINYYWEEVRKNLSNLTHPRIHITNLGDFTIKHWKLEGKIKSYEGWEEKNKQKGVQQMISRFKISENLFNLKAVQKTINEELQRKDFIKLHKTKANVKSRKKHNKNLEEQGSDS